jgi:ABC-type uncharacterized transport system fused permease/ATPase subunit
MFGHCIILTLTDTTLFWACYRYATELIPMLTLAPLYFEGAIQFGVISQGYVYPLSSAS